MGASIRRVLVIAATVALLGLAWLTYRGHRDVMALRQSVKDIQWQIEVANHLRDTKTASLEVGVIQFIGAGYSITLDSVSYDANGVRLVGTIGNGNAFNVSSLTANFAVAKPFWSLRDTFMKMKDPEFFGFDDSWTIGKAQVVVGNLGVGAKAPFSVTVPNVKQTKESPVLNVAFSGERYAYLR